MPLGMLELARGGACTMILERAERVIAISEDPDDKKKPSRPGSNGNNPGQPVPDKKIQPARPIPGSGDENGHDKESEPKQPPQNQ